MSGGVDSTVAAVMLHKAVGNQLTCMFVDHGLLRKEEGNLVEAMCKDHFHMNFLRINAQDRFFNRLSGVEARKKNAKSLEKNLSGYLKKKAENWERWTF